MNNRRKRKSTRPRVDRIIADHCLCCSLKNPWVETPVQFNQEYRGQMHTVDTAVMRCKSCGYNTTSHEQDGEYIDKLKLAHQKWLASYVEEMRKKLGLTIRDFDTKTKISSSTISRLKRGSLPDASSEKLLIYELEQIAKRKTEERIHTMVSKGAEAQAKRVTVRLYHYEESSGYSSEMFMRQLSNVYLGMCRSGKRNSKKQGRSSKGINKRGLLLDGNELVSA